MRRIFFIGVFAAFLLSACSEQEPEHEGPNIILFVSDDHGLDALGCYGNPVVKTPNLDKLATEGVRFNNAYCTSASCAASRSVILSGLYSHANGTYGHVHDYHHFRAYDKVRSLSVMLEEAGYLTARIGKYHLTEKVYRFMKELKADPRNTVEMAEQCTGVLASDKPFFLYFCTDDPHRGAPFSPVNWDEPNSFGNKLEGYPGVEAIKYSPDEVIVPEFLPDTKECRAELAQYYQSVSRIDQGFGKLMEMLEAAGKKENTVVFYISDNGIAFPGAKTTVYEPGIKLPCIVRDPRKGNQGGTSDAMISWVDLTPTILDMAGLEYSPEKFQGRSFEGIIDSPSPAGWNEVFASHTFHEITMYYPMRVYRKDNYKLIWNIAWRLDYPFASDLWAASTWQGIYRSKAEYYGHRKVDDYLFRAEWELYDLSADPEEAINLAENKEYAEVLEEMKQRLKAFQKETSDPWLIMWDHDSSLQGTGVNL